MQKGLISTRFLNFENNSQENITHIQYQIMCFDPDNCKNIMFRSPMVRIEIGKSSETYVPLPPTTSKRTAEPQIAIHLCDGELIVFSTQLYISQMNGTDQKCMIQSSYITFNCNITKEQHNNDYQFVTIPSFKIALPNFKFKDSEMCLFKHYCLELFTDYSIREELQFCNDTQNDELYLEIGSSVSIALQNQIDSQNNNLILKISGAPFNFGSKTQYFSLAQINLDVNELQSLRSRVVRLNLDYPQFGKRFQTFCKMLEQVIMIPASFGSEKLKKDEILRNGVPFGLIDYFMQMNKITDYQIYQSQQLNEYYNYRLNLRNFEDNETFHYLSKQIGYRDVQGVKQITYLENTSKQNIPNASEELSNVPHLQLNNDSIGSVLFNDSFLVQNHTRHAKGAIPRQHSSLQRNLTNYTTSIDDSQNYSKSNLNMIKIEFQVSKSVQLSLNGVESHLQKLNGIQTRQTEGLSQILIPIGFLRNNNKYYLKIKVVQQQIESLNLNDKSRRPDQAIDNESQIFLDDFSFDQQQQQDDSAVANTVQQESIQKYREKQLNLIPLIQRKEKFNNSILYVKIAGDVDTTITCLFNNYQFRQPNTFYEALNTPFVGVRDAKIVDTIIFQLYDEQLQIVDFQSMNYLQFKQVVYQKPVQIQFKLEYNQLQYLLFIQTNDEQVADDEVKDKLMLIQQKHQLELQKLDNEQLFYQIDVCDQGTQCDEEEYQFNVISKKSNLYNVKYLAKKLDKSLEVFTTKDEVEMRRELISKCKLDEFYFGKQFFVIQNNANKLKQEQFTQQYVKLFNVQLVNENDQDMLQGFTYIQNQKLFPKSYSVMRTREVQITFLALKLDVKSKKQFKFDEMTVLLNKDGDEIKDIGGVNVENSSVVNDQLRLLNGQVLDLDQLYFSGQQIYQKGQSAKLDGQLLKLGSSKYDIMLLSDKNGEKAVKYYQIVNSHVVNIEGRQLCSVESLVDENKNKVDCFESQFDVNNQLLNQRCNAISSADTLYSKQHDFKSITQLNENIEQKSNIFAKANSVKITSSVSSSNFKLSIDGQLVSPQSQKLGKLEEMYVKGELILKDVKLTPILVLKYKFVDCQIISPDGSVLCLLQDLQYEDGRFVCDFIQIQQIRLLKNTRRSSKVGSAASASPFQQQTSPFQRGRPRNTFRVGLDGSLLIKSTRLCKLQELVYYGKPVLGSLQVTPLNAAQFVIQEGNLISPHGIDLGEVEDFIFNNKSIGDYLTEMDAQTESESKKQQKQISYKISIDGYLMENGVKKAKLAEMMDEYGDSVLDGLKITPLNAMKFKIKENILYAPDGQDLGDVATFQALSKEQLQLKQMQLLEQKVDLVQTQSGEMYKISIDCQLQRISDGAKLGKLADMIKSDGSKVLPGDVQMTPLNVMNFKIIHNILIDPDQNELGDVRGFKVKDKLQQQQSVDSSPKQKNTNTNFRVHMDGKLSYQSQQMGYLKDMLNNEGKMILEDIKLTPLNAIKFKIYDNNLFGPDGDDLGDIRDFTVKQDNGDQIKLDQVIEQINNRKE